MRDARLREITYLRLSVTDRCNLRCQYCMAEDGVSLVDHADLLSYEKLLWLVSQFCRYGVKRLRITGGEPLVRRGVLEFLEALKTQHPSLELALTTNGTLAVPIATRLSKFLHSVSVSLDSLKEERYHSITRLGTLHRALEGIKALRDAWAPRTVKINTVVIKGFNDDEVTDLVNFAAREKLLLRFIEFMPLDSRIWNESAFLPAQAIREALHDVKQWQPSHSPRRSVDGPARYWTHQQTGQSVGFITAVSEHFCDNCNRMRLTATGDLHPCLFSPHFTPLAEAAHRQDSQLFDKLLETTLQGKPQGWQILDEKGATMSQLGG